jgi:hypothetical protein
MTNRSILNAAPAIVAWGLARGLLSRKPAPEPDYLAKYRDQQRRAAQQGMRKLRAERTAKVDLEALK